MSPLVVGLVITLNIVVLVLYGIDKYKAVAGKWRISEKTLILCGLVAPFGAVIGMQAFHHKTRKPLFKLNYVFLVLHLALIVYFFVL